MKRALVASAAVLCVVTLATCGPTEQGGAIARLRAALGQPFGAETEPNDSAPQATPIGPDGVVRANVVPNGDADFYSFTASAGDRIYAATMTAFSSSSDSILAVIGPDGTTVLETDDNDGSFTASSSSIAGTPLLAAGTHYLRVTHASTTNQLRPYDLHFRLRSGTPSAEIEPNDTMVDAQPLTAAGWIAGVTSDATDVDLYSLTLAAGDTIYASLDIDPARAGVEWNATLGFGPFAGQFLTASRPSSPGPDSEALFATVKSAGTYYLRVASAGGSGIYNLSVSVHPAAPALNCTTYTSTDAPQAIPDPGLLTSTIVVPGNPRIADVNVSVQLTHVTPPDLDVTLRGPMDSEIGLFTDVGLATGSTTLDITLDDEAAIPVSSTTLLDGLMVTPELDYRLHWFDRASGGGTWTLSVRDDAPGGSGNLTGWSLRICEEAPATCPGGGAPLTVLATDFESGPAGFTSSGVQNEWAHGTPTAAPISTCHGGTQCWKTDLSGTYNADSIQDLVSAPISLVGLTPPIRASWAMRYQMESASFDHLHVEIREVGGANPRRLFEHLAQTMTTPVGSPSVTLAETSGWGVYTFDVSEYAGQTVELVFHLDSDGTVQLAGAAIDDVAVTACGLCGNGTLEQGEQCDEGAANGEPGSCCAATCELLPAATACRPAASDCDVAETCDGAAPTCPADLAATDGTACSDGNGCTGVDTCQAGTCVGANPVICSAPDQCHDTGVCDPGTGACSNPAKPNGTPCDDADACTQTDACQAGVCGGGNPKSCPALNQCHLPGICDPGTGVCSQPAKPDGASCDDGDACTVGDACAGGLCAGGTPKQCQPLNQCYEAGTCQPATGVCMSTPKPNGAGCDDGDACTRADVCQGGVCTGTDPVVCEAESACHAAGTCDQVTGACFSPLQPDGTVCPSGACQEGQCIQTVDPDGCGCSAGGGELWGLSLLALGLVRRRRRDASARA